MNMLTKRLLPLLLALAMVASMVGCGSSAPAAQPAAPSAPAASSEPAPAPAPAPEPAPVPEPAPAPEPVDDGTIKLSAEEMDLSVRDAKSSKGMVTSASPIASKVGLTILEKGGNAVDAAVAVAYALGMVEPNASGIGGDGYMMVYDAATGKSTFLDYKGEAAAGYTLDFHVSHKEKDGAKFAHSGYSANVPGVVAGMEKANELFGTMTMAELIQPAIDFAEKGVPITSFMASAYGDYIDLIKSNPETAKVFTNDGFPWMTGETFTNPEYAAVLKRIAAEGKDAFYTGEVAQSIVDTLAKYGGVMTLEDLARFRVAVREPITTNYRGYKVVAGAPSSGGIAVVEALNMAEHFNINAMGHNTPEALHTWAEIFKLSSVDRYHYLGDPDYTDPTGMYAIATKDFAAERVKAVKPDRVLGKTTWLDYNEIEGAHTTHVSIVDQWGNMVAMTNTIGDFFGNGIVIEGCGFLTNNGAKNFSTAYKANYPRPGQKVRSSIAPVLLFNPDGTPLATLGTPGGARIPSTVTQIVSNIIDFGMDMQEAINAARIYQNYNDGLYIEGHMDPQTVYEMKLRGHYVIERGKNDFFFGGVQGVKIDKATGELHGGADPRRDGKALGF